jgi:fatty acid desaturase
VRPIATAFRLLSSLLFDDGRLALAIVALLACSSLIARLGPDASLLAMALLVWGTLILLFESVMHAARGQ